MWLGRASRPALSRRFRTASHAAQSRLNLAVLTSFLVLVGLARAEGSQQGLLGDWGGARPWLSEHGIDLDLGYINELAQAAAGGPAGTADADQFYFGGSLSLDRILGVPQARILFSFTDRNGTSLSLRPGLETLLEVQEIYGEGNYTRLNQLFWEQQLFDQTLSLKLGRLTGTFDFMPFSCNFQNITFCATLTSHNVVPNWVAFPGGTWAAVVRMAPRPRWYAQLGMYEVAPALQKHGARFVLGKPFGGPGQRFIAEFGWLPAAEGEGSGYRVGLWYDNVGGSDFYLNEAGSPLATYGGTPLQHRQQSGFYLMAQQRLYSGAAENSGLAIFMNFVQADRQVSVKDQIAEVGVFWTGPFRFRPQDEIGIAVARVHTSTRLSASERLYDAEVAIPAGKSLEPVQTAEYPAEVYYSLALTPSVVVRPNLQLIGSPDGVRGRSTLVIVGLHFSVLF